MLILSRRPGESIMIGNEITVTMLGTKAGSARLGITAPPEVVVNREELHLRIQNEKIARKRAEARALSVLSSHTAQEVQPNIDSPVTQTTIAPIVRSGTRKGRQAGR